jgi:hypothetical protein
MSRDDYVIHFDRKQTFDRSGIRDVSFSTSEKHVCSKIAAKNEKFEP